LVLESKLFVTTILTVFFVRWRRLTDFERLLYPNIRVTSNVSVASRAGRDHCNGCHLGVISQRIQGIRPTRYRMRHSIMYPISAFTLRSGGGHKIHLLGQVVYKVVSIS